MRDAVLKGLVNLKKKEIRSSLQDLSAPIQQHFLDKKLFTPTISLTYI
jgi:hypothetical protein